jgi:hypothetical protein
MPEKDLQQPVLSPLRAAGEVEEPPRAASGLTGADGHRYGDWNPFVPLAHDARTGAAAATAGVDRAIRVSTAIAVLAVGGVAAYVSYWHAYAVVRAHGETGVTARLEPATIDGLVYASSMVNLYAARHRLAMPSLARWLLALGIVATLAANMAQGWSHGAVGAVIAAWPAVSLVGSYELLVWIIRTAATRDLVRGPAANHSRPQADHADQADQFSSPLGLVTTVGLDVNAAAVAAYRASVQAGKPLSERKLAGQFGKTSRRWARRRLAEAQQHPVPA